MNQITLKKLYLLGIKYGPSIMAITCCFKLFFDSIEGVSTGIYEDIIHCINVLLDWFIIWLFYITGLYFNFCWKHQSLCKISAWGYLFYLIFLIVKPDQIITIILTSWFLIFTVIVTLSYKRL